MTEFIDREKELNLLKENYKSDEAELIIIHGRRRIGKSVLARKSLENLEKKIYYQATETTPKVQLEEFVDAAEENFPGIKNIKKDWESLLKFLGGKDAVVVIDEFPYLIKSDGSVPSKFQRIWDQELQDSGIKLILIGSSISIMEDKVLSGGSPLHGRRTDHIDLKPLSFQDAAKFYPRYSPIEKIIAWSIFGGTPHYLKSLNGEKSIEENVKNLILSEQGLLREEPDFLLRSELENPSRYMSILKAVSRGKVSRNEIAQEIGVDGSKMGSYISKLQTLRLVEREVPVTEEPPRSRSGQYRVSEPLFRFWFRFVYGKEDRISLSENPYEEIVEPEINDYVSPHFERLCQERLPELLPRKYRKVGRWWYRDEEVDVMGITEEGKILGECKFRDSKMDKRHLTRLESKENDVRIEGNTEFALFSKGGFNQALKKESQEKEDLHLFEIEDVVP